MSQTWQGGVFNSTANFNDRAVGFSVTLEYDEGLNPLDALGTENLTALLVGPLKNALDSDNGEVVQLNKATTLFIKPRGLFESGIKALAQEGNDVRIEGRNTSSKWLVETAYNKHAVYSFINMSSNLALDNNLSNTSDCYVYFNHGLENQQWVLVRYDHWTWMEPEFKIVNVQTGKVLERYNNNTQVRMANNVANSRVADQRWYLH